VPPPTVAYGHFKPDAGTPSPQLNQPLHLIWIFGGPGLSTWTAL